MHRRSPHYLVSTLSAYQEGRTLIMTLRTTMRLQVSIYFADIIVVMRVALCYSIRVKRHINPSHHHACAQNRGVVHNLSDIGSESGLPTNEGKITYVGHPKKVRFVAKNFTSKKSHHQ